MDLLAYWRFDNYLRDLDEGAGFHFNSRQSRLHTAINKGERLWLFTRVVNHTRSEYRLLAQLIITMKTINAPSYNYGPYRVWSDIKLSQYYKVTNDSKEDIFELLRLLDLDGISLKDKDRTSLARACQTIRALQPSASKLLQSYAATLSLEPRAKAVLDEESLEKALYLSDSNKITLMLEEPSIGYAEDRKIQLRHSYERNRQLVQTLYNLYQGRCQVTGHDSPLLYGVPTAEAHHIIYRARGGEDSLENIILLCPNLHRAIHAADAKFDYSTLSFVFSNRRVEPLILNRHLKRRIV